MTTSTARKRTYAAGTTVAVSKTKADIEHELTRFGATAFAYMTEGPMAALLFKKDGRQIRISLALPDPTERRFTHSDTWRLRSDSAARNLYEQACRERWRGLYMIVKAKLVAIELGVESFESAFLAQMLLPNHSTVGEWIAPQLDDVYASGQMPPLLPSAAPIMLPAPRETE
jgi:hypothetical protein